MPKDSAPRGALPEASLRDRLGFVAKVTAPMLAKGPLIRRPRAVAVSERFDLDGRGVRELRRLRERYGDGPLIVRIPGRTHAVILSPAHVQRVLAETPDPFSPATDEKSAALGHFEPAVSLVSKGDARTERRRFNDQVLENDRPTHAMAAPFLEVVREEMDRLLAEGGDALDWGRFFPAWCAIVRRIVLGDGARDDDALTDLLETMRTRGNWVMLRRRRTDMLDRFRARVGEHLARADEGSLAARIACLPKSGRTAPADQIAHYLFAFDPGGMATFRALALVAAHPDALARAREEVADADADAAAGEGREMLPYLRATLLESLRLWPTTPVVLRQTTRDTEWEGGILPKGANVIVFAPFFHRDDSLPFAHRFAPEIWLEEGEAAKERPVRTAVDGAVALVPFSYGPGRCPASDLVPMVGGAALAAILSARTPRLADPGRLDAAAPMPSILDNYTLAFRLER
jgi:cytochrome P450